jgi:hypothetical protein
MAFVQQHVDTDVASYNLGAVTRLIIMREYYHELFELFSEAGFEALKDIYSFDVHQKAEDAFSQRYGEKWGGLTRNFYKYKGLVNLGDPKGKTTNDYARSVLDLFGRED